MIIYIYSYITTVLFHHRPLSISRLVIYIGFDSRRCNVFLFSTASRPALGLTQPPIQWVPGASSPGVKRPEAWSWPVTSIQRRGQEWWSYTCTPPYVFMAQYFLPLCYTQSKPPRLLFLLIPFKLTSSSVVVFLDTIHRPASYLFKIQRFRDCILSPSSGRTYSVGPDR
jgi:hypothetical protein